MSSMSREGNCYDNAQTEHFFSLLKSERMTAYRLFTRNDAKIEILDYISYYNSIQPHSTLGYLASIEYVKEQYLKVAKF